MLVDRSERLASVPCAGDDREALLDQHTRDGLENGRMIVGEQAGDRPALRRRPFGRAASRRPDNETIQLVSFLLALPPPLPYVRAIGRFTFVTTPDPSPGERLAVGIVDLAGSLLDAWSYVADVLTSYQEKIAGESYLGSEWHEASSTLRIRFDVAPAVCVVGDDRQAVFVVVGSATGDATLSFGEGVRGERPSSGAGVRVTYRRGGGGAGDLVLEGIPFEAPFVVIALDSGGARVRRICSQSAER